MESLLHFREYSPGIPGTGVIPVILIHGLFGSGDNFHTVAVELARDYPVVVPDMRNHGRSFHSPDTSYEAMAGDLERLMDRLSIPKAYIVGHSMGGKCAMRFAALNPDRAAALVIEDIGPGVHPQHYRRETDAMLDLDVHSLESRGSAEKILEKSVPDPVLRLFLLKNLERAGDGTYRWRNNIEGISEGYDEIWKPAVSTGMIYDGPGLFLKGEKSRAITPNDREIIRRQFPGSTVRVVEDAGHWIHAEKRDDFITAVRDFIASIPK